MMTLSVCFNYLKTYLASLLFICVLLSLHSHVTAQSVSPIETRDSLKSVSNQTSELTSTKKDTVPIPKAVMFKSLIIPGWGQVVNKQTWKVPIVYSAILGLGYYSYWLHGQYSDFRAAYYNSFAESDATYADERFGPTPDRLIGAVPSVLLNYRDYYRNQRDLMIVYTVLMYGLNAVDAYIFAHLRDFDVSDQLTAEVVPIQVNGLWSSQLKLTVRFGK